MAKAKAAKAGAAYGAAKTGPYVQRLVQDEDLRDNLRTAVESTKAAYQRLTNGKAPQKVVFDDKKFHRNVEEAAQALRDASLALREPTKKRKSRRKGGGLGKLLMLGIVGGIAALVASEDLRNKALDALFGAEEEFDYTSTTAPASQPSTAESASPAGA